MTALAAALVLAGALHFGVADWDEDAELEEPVAPAWSPPRCQPRCSRVDVDRAIHDAAVTYGVSEARLSCLARRESTMNPSASNGRYAGLYQFDGPTWLLTPWTSESPYEPWPAAQGAAFLISRGQGSRWPPLAFC